MPLEGLQMMYLDVKFIKNVLSISRDAIDWNVQYDHNQLRITRVIECLRLLVSDEEADNFYNNVIELIKDNNRINIRTLNFWKNA